MLHAKTDQNWPMFHRVIHKIKVALFLDMLYIILQGAAKKVNP